MLRISLCLCLFACASGCSFSSPPGEEPWDGSDGSAQDAGYEALHADMDGGDLAVESDDGTDGTDTGLWEWCPDASEYIGGAWDYQAIVTNDALLCVVNQGRTVEQAMRNKAQLRLVASSYPLPDTDGTYAVMIPACIRVPGREESHHAGEGVLTVSSRDIGGTIRQYEFTQPMRVGLQRWDAGWNAHLYFPGGVQPQIIFDNRLNRFEGGTEVFVGYRLGVEGFEQAWQTLPCDPAMANLRVTIATFDRGSLTVEADVYSEVAFGGHAPAILRRVHGELDGVPIDQNDYDRLSHLPAHHNWGGSFLVMFEEPIGQACGIKLDVPSIDGGGPSLGAWTVDCDLAPLAELTGLIVAPP
jgi:hypothetical protein